MILSIRKEVALLLLLISCSVFSSDGSILRSPELFIHKGLSEKESITVFYQDSDGLLWLGSEYGVLTFDGKNVERLNPGDPEQEFSITRVNAIVEFKDKLWIAASNQLITYSKETASLANVSPDFDTGELLSFFVDNQNILWIGTSKGVLRYFHSRNSFEYVAFDSVVERELHLPLEDGQCILKDGNRLLVVTGNGVIVSITSDTNEIEIDSYIQLGLVHQCTQDSRGIWLSSDSGLWLRSVTDKQVSQIYAENVRGSASLEGQLWFSSNETLWQMSSDTNIPVDIGDGGFSKLFLDNEGTLWASKSEGGIYRYAPSANKFTNLLLSDEKLYIEDVLRVKEQFWIATSKGLYVWDGKSAFSKILEQRRFILLYKGVENIIGVSEHSVTWIDPQTGSITRQVPIVSTKKSGLKPTSVVEDKQSRVWIGLSGARNSNILFIENSSVEFKAYQGAGFESYLSANFLSITPDANNKGIRIYADAMREARIETESLELSPVLEQKPPFKELRKVKYEQGRVVLFHNDNDISLGRADKEAGLNHLELLNSPVASVECIVEQSNDVLWLFDRAGLLWRWLPKHNKLTEYNQDDGLPESGLTGDFCYYDKDNRQLFFSAKNSIATINVRSIKENKKAPTTYLIQARVNRSSVNIVNDSLYLNEDDHLRIEARNSSLVSPDKNQWLWVLSGKGNIYKGKEQEFNLASISTGEYTLTYSSSNNDGVWGSERSLRIFVKPPFWKSKLAIFLYMIMAIVFIGIYVLRSHYHRELLKRKVEERTREVSSLLKQKERLFTGVSHEFRTPITLIMANAEKIDSQHSKVSQQLKANARHLLNLVEELLEFSVSGIRNETSQVTIDLSAATKAIVYSFKELIISSGLRDNIHIDSSVVSKVAYGDYEKILSNLLTNAVKYNVSDGWISVELSADSENILLSVKDGGVGIKEGELDKIFEPLYRSPDISSIDGNGIGLSLVSELVKKNNGKIVVRSHYGKGSEFLVKLPAASVSSEKEIESQFKVSVIDKAAYPVQQAHCDELRLVEPVDYDDSKPIALIVEDNIHLRELICDSVSEDFSILSAEDGAQGIELALAHVPDIIVSDIMMPKKDGFSLLEDIRNNRLTSHIPLILLTAKTDFESRLKGWDEMADDFITKPFSAHELVMRMRALISIRNILKNQYSSYIENERRDSGAVSNVPEKDALFVNELDSVVEKFYADVEFKVAQLAQNMSVSERQLHRKLKARFDITPTEYLRNYRLEKAKLKLIEGEGASIVCYEVGFSSHSYFTKCFKAKYNVLPSDIYELDS
ncbi:ATP-binding protein [Pleionea sp. CnH1-48]|uniref:hybrid sensor histidine kinase/response regulator transcription factor n=1 Tax=Pleionea sp. CnH1-48 TaxID=2954494 RepID=UPI0020985950|nr:ATP-binding protein [Pleionea sp. CnH1-48]MCO7225623.1 response regulator [Pleionea sp. CnH1-48]